MAQQPESFIDKLNRLAASGVESVGLEVAAESGLVQAQFCQIPERWAKLCQFYFVPEGKIPTTLTPAQIEALSDAWMGRVGRAHAATPGGPHYAKLVEDLPADGGTHAIKCKGIVSLIGFFSKVYVRKEKHFMRFGNGLKQVVFVQAEPYTAEDVQEFMCMNIPIFLGMNCSNELAFFFATVRMHGVMQGLIQGHHSREWTVVNEKAAALEWVKDDVLEGTSNADEARNALLLIAARYLSYRHTGHAIGTRSDRPTSGTGPFARYSGFFAKAAGVIGKPKSPGQSDADYVAAMYAAVHCSEPHCIATAIFSGDSNNWACYAPTFGRMKTMTPEASLKIRGDLTTGVAGVKIIVDSYVAMKEAIASRMAFLLEGTDQIHRLKEAYDKVVAAGMCTGRAAAYWVRDNPWNLQVIQIDQANEGGLQLTADLASFAIHYRPSATLANSPSLAKHADLYSSVLRKDMWTQLKKARAGVRPSAAIALMQVCGAEERAVSVEKAFVQDTHDQTIDGINANLKAWADVWKISAPPALKHKTAAELAEAETAASAVLAELEAARVLAKK
jgi:hypothetical protein